MKKVLIITYYWIPSGGAGVQRWVKFTKYIRDFGWEPIIYTPENPEFPSIDTSFEKDIPTDIQILKTPIWEPYNLYRYIKGNKNGALKASFISENNKQSWKDKLSILIRGNFLIPDPRFFWVRPSVKYLSNYIEANPVDAIISTGPPHSMHLIGMKLKKRFQHIPWIADFRDPWTNIDFYKELNLSYISDKIHHNLEKKVIQSTDTLLVVSQGMKEEYSTFKPKKIQIITNGYDNDDMKLSDIHLDKKFSISHIGSLNTARNPYTVWKVLNKICSENQKFKEDLLIQLVGKVDYTVIEDIKKFQLENNLLKIDYLTHQEAIIKQQSSQVLLLLINQSNNAKGILTGKFFEYLSAKRPILGVGPTDGDAADILKETKAGYMVDFEDETETEKIILMYYELYLNNKLIVDSQSVEKYSRKNLTNELSDILNSLTK